jgi:multidrug efflux system membrane fusion protein
MARITDPISTHPVIGPERQIAAPVSWYLRHRRRYLVLGGLLLFGIALIVLLLILRHRSAERTAALAHAKPAAITVTSATAQKGSIGVYLDAIGTVTPVYTASITSQVGGLIASVHYLEGQRVAKGDALVDIDPRSYRALLLQAQGSLARDQGLLAQAQMDLERYRAAWARNAIAHQILEDQEKLVQQDQGTVMTDQGTLQYDQVQLDYCHIVAPIAGRVGLRLVDPGNVVQSAGTVTLAVITQLQPITVIFTVPEDSLAAVVSRLHAGAKLTVDAYDRTAQQKLASGQLLALDNQIDTTTGTVKGRALFDNRNDLFFPNQFVNTRLLVNTLQGVTLLPAAAIQHDGPASFVYVIQANVAQQRTVKPGVTEGGNTQVDGVAPGEIVASSNFDKLQDKVAVNIVNTPAPAGTGASGRH